MNKKILVLFSYSFLLLVVGCGAPRIIDDADGVSVEYRLSFEDGTLYRSGTEYIEIGKYDTDLADMFTDLLIGKQGDDVFTGMLSPDETYGKQYDYSLQQKLAEPYLSAMGSEPVVWELVAFSNIGTGIVRAIDQEEGVKQYTIDFNPRETFEPLNYEVKIVSVEKK